MKNVKYVACASYLSPHAKYVSDEMHRLIGSTYKRISTKRMPSERLNLGYQTYQNIDYHFEMNPENEGEINTILTECDIFEYGSAPEEFLRRAVENNKIVFIRMERILKEGIWKLLYPPVLIKYLKKYTFNRSNENVFYLCTSAYAASDLRRIGIRNDRVLRWAYCPEFIEYNIDDLLNSKSKEKIEILWVGRLINWKHPEIAIKVAKLLSDEGFDFKLRIIGSGILSEKLKFMVSKEGLNNFVEFLGSVPSEKVREYMKNANILLATSDFNEGWGAVINEGMNSGCAIVASHAMGAAPFLIRHKDNGMIFKNGDYYGAYLIIKELIQNKSKMETLGVNAYKTIRDGYRPEICANRIITMAESILEGKSFHFDSGMGSIAPIIKNSDYKKIISGGFL